MSKQLFVLLAAIFMTTACSITVRTPVSRFDTPETMGRPGRIDLNAGRGGANNAILSRSVGAGPPDTVNVEHQRSSYVFLGGDVALGDSIDVGIRNYQELRAKFQLFGASRTRARAGDTSGAVLLTAGAYVDQSSAVSLIPSTSIDSKKLEIMGEVGATVGHRFLDWILFYISGSARYTNFDGTYNVTPNGPTGSGSPTSTAYSGNVVSYNANAGLEFGIPAIGVRVEYGYGQHQSGNMNRGADYWGAQGYVAFDLAHSDPPAVVPPPAAAPKRVKPLRRPNVDEDADSGDFVPEGSSSASQPRVGG